MERRALISVTDKKGLDNFAKTLTDLGFEIVSTGGTLKFLIEKGIKVTPIEKVTGFKEMIGGRVKTLHPNIHGGILYIRDNKGHENEIVSEGIKPIDIVVCNLYLFKETVKKNPTLEDAIENIDIGGVTLLRASAKNFKYVTVIVDSSDYEIVAKELLEKGNTSYETRKRLCVKAFTHTADYDSAIETYLSEVLIDNKKLRLSFDSGVNLRYGENWHQTASFFKKDTNEPSVANMKQLHGKALSYNNYLDIEAALNPAKELSQYNAAVIVKHLNPCGIATGKTLLDALKNAWDGDRVSAYGSIIALTRNVDLETASFLKGKFVEVIVAPSYNADALEFLKNKSKDIRIIEIGKLFTSEEKIYKFLIGGVIEQDRPKGLYEKWECVTKEPFPESKKNLGLFTIIATKYTKSNSIVLGMEYEKDQFKVLGSGVGQPNRVDSLKKLAIPKIYENLENMWNEGKSKVDKETFFKEKISDCVLVSDAFFPFDDTVKVAAEHNIKYIIQSGGSIRDKEVIETSDKFGISMIFTGMRYFNH
ncbi:MAG TPA: bifunctional phosphoribosylaminoimidazolecarboxamide formyltransferase/IMP cyclohydrolase [Methanofastidiosum sp.]|nr:bifunctional phosphoribosylaminoimidazolecarboxamide formyltransferase/IMP cyclohydrolase [Methanofastidiosum sp.]HPA48770.1 bifunctional phosphoribosylaminoimidazolecarboxamide formyltransferase/IMP cyclohydrolase [Methanofastidiosum sp.]HQK61970.1 bifunctional phosphoribosylaminoimidazolecarboxamide formyltransferase/IMP cyclohydrolase [Methanofastidiosum sp.]HQM94079.1 bifunctional phosphoribosylaminoimidazolecarboxamide formyltransferase/IMP cyclohydrolase [Methanofastidiosum sp.]HQQ4811